MARPSSMLDSFYFCSIVFYSSVLSDRINLKHRLTTENSLSSRFLCASLKYWKTRTQKVTVMIPKMLAKLGLSTAFWNRWHISLQKFRKSCRKLLWKFFKKESILALRPPTVYSPSAHPLFIFSTIVYYFSATSLMTTTCYYSTRTLSSRITVPSASFRSS